MSPRSGLPALPDPAKARSPGELMAGLRRHRDLLGLTVDDVRTRLTAMRDTGVPGAGRTTIFRYLFKDELESWPDDQLVFDLANVVFDDPAYVEYWRERWYVVHDLMLAQNAVRVWNELPDRVGELVGRDEMITQITSEAWVSIVGLAGVGKTAMMIDAAWVLRSRQPFDKIMFVDLRGVPRDPANPPVATSAVLGKFLRLLDVRDVPQGMKERADLFRKHSRQRRLLVLLDNAADLAQIEPLLTDGPGSVTLITSRNRLADLPGLAQVHVGLLSTADALMLLRNACPARFDADEAAAGLAVRLLRCHPLALRTVATHLRRNPDWSLADHVHRLAGALLGLPKDASRIEIEQRLSEAEQGRGHGIGVHESVVAEIDLSYQVLTSRAQRLLCLMADHPCHDLTLDGAVALLGADASALVDALVGANLVVRRSTDRFELHDIVSGYATARAEEDVPLSQRREAMGRMLCHYINLVTKAVNAESFGDAEARAWLAAEIPNITITAVRAARDPAVSCHVHELADGIEPYLFTEARHQDAAGIHDAAITASTACEHRAARTSALTAAGRAHRQLGDLTRSAQHLQVALELHRKDGDKVAEAKVLNKLGLTVRVQGNHREAASLFRRAVELQSKLGELPDLVLSLGNLGVTYDLDGCLDDALACYDQVIELGTSLGNDLVVAKALCDSGTIYKRRRDLRTAIDYYRRARRIFRQRDKSAGATCVENLGHAHLLDGRPELALKLLTKALTMREQFGEADKRSNTHHDLALTHQALGDPQAAMLNAVESYDTAATHGLETCLCRAANLLGELLAAAGDQTRARSRFEEALQLAVRHGNRDEQARAHVGLANLADSQDGEVSHLRRAHALYLHMGVPEQDEVRLRLERVRP